ncbi:MAG: hypothetical protein ABTQ31_15260 [Rhizobiaceae bacterium]
MRRRNGKIVEDAAPANLTGGARVDIDNLEKYLVHIAHLDMALSMKIELIRVVGGMMQSFVDRAFGDDPVQQAMLDGDDENKTDAPGVSDVVNSRRSSDSENSLTNYFRRNAGNNNKNKECR